MAGSSNGDMPFPQCWIRTQVKVDKVRFIWTLNNFSFCNYDHGKGKNALKSLTFSAGAAENFKFYLKLFPEGLKNVPIGKYVSLFIVTETRDRFNANLQFSILDAKHNQTNVKELRHRFTSHRQRAGFRRFITRDLLLNEANGLLPEDKFTIICEVAVLKDIINSSGQSCAVKIRVPECPFAEDLGAIFDKQLLCDVMLTADGTEIKAHKFVLAARSPVFAAMFEHDMVERKHDHVNINDVKPEVLREMLRYLYTGRASNLDGELLAAADMYALERLKVMCEEELWKNLTIETAAETLIVADMRSADQLKTLTMDFICGNHGVEGTAGWTNMMTTHPHLIDETMRAFITRKEQHVPPMIGPPHKRFRPAD